jgi:hypothetical protein
MLMFLCTLCGHWLSTAVAQLLSAGQVIWDLWWSKQNWGRFSPSTPVSSAPQNFLVLIVILWCVSHHLDIQCLQNVLNDPVKSLQHDCERMLTKRIEMFENAAVVSRMLQIDDYKFHFIIYNLLEWWHNFFHLCLMKLICFK